MKILPDKLEPQAVKIAKATDIVAEVANYHEHVENRLGGHFHTRLERHVRFWDVGAALYSFLGTPLDTIKTFSTFYREQSNTDKIMRPLQHFFGEVWHRHYNAQQVLPDGQTLYDEYNKKFGLETKLQSDPAPELYRILAQVDVELPDPIDWLRRHKNDSRVADAKQAVVHGDLHGDNMFVSQQYGWVIDFERTGPSHALRDFAELEIDILTRLLSTEKMPAAAFQINFVALLQLLMQVEAGRWPGTDRFSTHGDPEDGPGLHKGG